MCLVEEGQGADELREERHRDALVAFLSSGVTGRPSSAAMVTALSDARRAVAMHREQRLPLDGWLANEVRLRGIRENAAVLAALELAEYRDRAAEVYSREHPERSAVLDAFLAAVKQSRPEH